MELRYQIVPKEPRANLLWRRKLVEACQRDRGRQAAVRELCKHDLLFWVNAFCFTFDPRRVKSNPHLPFVTWDYQDEVLRTFERHVGTDDIVIEKSRDMGASWLCLLHFQHQWQFWPGRAFLVVSRNEDLVDKSDDPDSLFWKLDYLRTRQPRFLQPPAVHRVHLHLGNLANGSYIDGASTTGDVGRGGRRTAVMLDEFAAFDEGKDEAADAATAANTNSRIFNSTYKGTRGSFVKQAKRNDIVKISLPWTKHPEKVAGHKPHGGGRFGWSPWWQKMANRLVTPALIASEVDMDSQGAESPFFPADLVQRLLVRCRPPLVRGRLGSDKTFVADPSGPLKLWTAFKPPYYQPDPGEQYVVGGDIGAGVGATPSVLSIVEKRTREKIGEFVTTGLDPGRFAEAAVALCRWFNDAFLIWESNGMVGQLFGKRVIELGYRQVYYRRDEKGLTHKLAEQVIPGWHATPDNKDLVLGAYLRALANSFFVNYSREAIDECTQYVWLPNQHVENATARGTTDPATGGRNHGDRVIADALANKALGDEPEVKLTPLDEEAALMANPPEHSLAWRRKQWQDQQRTSEWDSPRSSQRDWDETGITIQGWEPETSRNAW